MDLVKGVFLTEPAGGITKNRFLNQAQVLPSIYQIVRSIGVNWPNGWRKTVPGEILSAKD